MARGFRPVALLAARAADQKKGEAIRLIDSRRATGLCEFVLLVNVLSPAHLETLEEEIGKVMKAAGVGLLHRDGRESDLWRVLDYGGLMVHLLHERAREFYQLDKLYHGAPELPWKEGSAAPRPQRRLHAVQRRNP